MPAITGELVLGEPRWPAGQMAGSGGRRPGAFRCWHWSRARCPTFTCTGWLRWTGSPGGSRRWRRCRSMRWSWPRRPRCSPSRGLGGGAGRGVAVGAAGGGERGEPGRERRGGRADLDWAR